MTGLKTIIFISILLLLLTGCASVPEAGLTSPIIYTNTTLPSKTTSTDTPNPPTPSPLPTNTPYPTSPSQPPTITVCESGCDFLTVQAAIADSGTLDGAIIGILDEIHTEGGIVVSKNITIQGSDPEMTIIQAHEQNAQATERVFTIPEFVQITLRDLIIQNGYPTQAPYSGGGIRNQGNLTVENCLIRNNQAGDGGGILNRGNLLIINTTISHNYSDGIGDPGIECGTGGGINNAFQATLVVHNSLITSNIAESKGGGMHVACEGNATVINTEISQNKSTRNGGGVFLKGTLNLVDSQITRNSTPADGGGIIVYGTLNYTESSISNNLAGGNCIIWGDDSYKGKGEVVLENNTIVPDNNCHFK